MVRILVTVKPRMYREALALAFHDYRPDAEVLLAPPESLDGGMQSFGPHLIVRNDTDGASLMEMDGVVCRIDVMYSDGIDARIFMDGQVRQLQDISVTDLLRVLAEVEALIPGETAK